MTKTGTLTLLALTVFGAAAEASTGPCVPGDYQPESTPFMITGFWNSFDCNGTFGKLADIYSFSGTAGQQVRFTLHANNSVPPYLILRDPAGTQVASAPSQGAGVTISLPAAGGYYTLLRTGAYSIEATTTSNTIGSVQYALTMDTTVAPPPGSRFVPVTPCRIADTRNAAGTFGGPAMAGGTSRSFPVPLSGCGIPSSAQAYSLNVTVVPQGPLSYLTLWPTGQGQPTVSTLNSFNGSVVANAAIVPAGTSGAVSVFVTNSTDVILDINGYFDTSAGASDFYSVTPCRIADTRNPSGPLGGPSMLGGSTRGFPVSFSACGIPATASAYSLNATVVPTGPLYYLTLWPAGFAQPVVSTLNSFSGMVAANAAIVPAGSGGAVNAYVTNTTDLLLDTNGYFAPPAAGGLQFYPITPCRVSDTRNPAGSLGGPAVAGGTSRDFPVQATCGVPSTAQAYSLNVTVIPRGALSYLTLYPSGQNPPLVSTLNSFNGAIVANAAIVPAGIGGSVAVYATNTTDVILDINGYFAP